ncbi:MAG: hypothetical protein JW991_02845 [Candidatus Pacebacteria bacterium]|nr:hypothetical protein [Candidatus Paceibacterota bacterium]
MSNKLPSGASAIIVLGVVAVLVSIVVPLLSQTVVDVRITKQQEEQARAFSVAETGLERALVGGALPTGTVDNIHYEVTELGRGDASNYVYPRSVEKEMPITIWLAEHEGSVFDSEADLIMNPGPAERYNAGVIDFYWGNPGTSEASDQTPALEATLYYYLINPGPAPDYYQVKRYAFDPYGNRRLSNSFTEPDDIDGGNTIDSQEFQFYHHVSDLPCVGQNRCYALRLRLLYNDNQAHMVGLSGSGNIPRQGVCKESVATVLTSQVTSRLQRCVFYRDFPSLFDFVLYTGGDLTKAGL